MNILPWILPPLLGAVIGYVTNRIAISMLFRPYREKRLLGVRIPFTPGIIPKQRYTLSKSIGKMVSSHLFTEEALKKQLRSEKVQEQLRYYIREKLTLLLGAKSPVRGEGKPSSLTILIESLLPRMLAGAGRQSASLFWDKPLSKLLPDAYLENLLKQLFQGISREERQLGQIVSYDFVLAFSALVDRRYPEICNLVSSFLHRPLIQKQLELRGRKVLERVFDRMSSMQRLMLMAGQYDKALYEQMPGIVEDLLSQMDAGLEEEAIRRKIVQWLRILLLSLRRRSVGELVSMLAGGEEAREEESRLFVKALSSKLGELKPGSMLAFFGIENPEEAGKWIASLVHSVREGSGLFANVSLSSFISLDEGDIDRIATAAGDTLASALEENTALILEHVDVNSLVVNRIDELDVEMVEELLLIVIRNHLRYINWFGALLGSMIGGMQLLL